jgi:hypothetical protein
MSASSARLCVNCRFFHTYGERRRIVREVPGCSPNSDKPKIEVCGSVLLGQCRANPPRINFASSIDYEGFWPQLKADEWCGHWQAREAL